MTTSYGAPYSFGRTPGFGSGWTNLSEYLNQSNLNSISGLEEEPLWDPSNASSPYQNPKAVDFDTWLFNVRNPTGVHKTGSETTAPPDTPEEVNAPTDPSEFVYPSDRRERRAGGGRPGYGPVHPY